MISAIPIDDLAGTMQRFAAALVAEFGMADLCGSAANLTDLEEELDRQYWDLRDRAEQSGDSDSAWRAKFEQARAVTALRVSRGVDDYDSAMRVAYEAAAAVADQKRLLRMLCRARDDRP